MQDAELKFMLAAIPQIVDPLSLLKAPGDDLPVGLLMLWRIEIAAQQTRPSCRDGQRLVDA